VVVIVLIVVVVVLFIMGILAAIAVPSFLRYQRRAKASEADERVSLIARMVVTRYGELRSLPAPLPPTPPPGCGLRPWPADAAPGWGELDVQFGDPGYYSYSIEPMQGGTGVWVRAMGDLDCDGIFSRLERSVTVAPGGDPQMGPSIWTDDTE
jgi:hypothetical protein